LENLNNDPFTTRNFQNILYLKEKFEATVDDDSISLHSQQNIVTGILNTLGITNANDDDQKSNYSQSRKSSVTSSSSSSDDEALASLKTAGVDANENVIRRAEATEAKTKHDTSKISFQYSMPIMVFVLLKYNSFKTKIAESIVFNFSKLFD